MKKIFTILLSASMAMSASALTINDLAGQYELQNAVGSLTYIAYAGTATFGLEDGDTEANKDLINNIKITTDGEYLYFSNFMNITFYAEADLNAMTVTIPVQSITSPTGYSFTQCLYDSRMFPAEGESKPTFTDNDVQDIVLNITADGDLTLYKDGADGAEGYWDYIAHWGWSTNYGYVRGVFHKTGDIVPDDSIAPIIGKHTCTEFKGEWCSIWGTWDKNWFTFDISTGDGIEGIGVDPGAFDVYVNSLGGLDVQVCGLWWGGLAVTGTYEPETKTIVFPLQSVWGGYTFCNSSICDIEVPTADDVVPATAVVNEDGSITLNYTVEYENYPYLYATQVLGATESGIHSITSDEANAPVEYYNVNGMRVNPTNAGIYIVRQGNKVAKQVIR